MARTPTIFAFTMAAFLAAASPAFAQVCAGIPMATGSTMGMVGLSFPENANSFGIGAMHKLNDQVVVGGEYLFTSHDDVFGASVPSSHSIMASGSYEIPVGEQAANADFAVCPTAGLGFGKWDALSTIAIPLGVSFGGAFTVADGSAVVAPYLAPQFVWARYSANGASDSESDLGFSMGANFHVSNFLVGAGYTKIGDGDGTLGIRFGLMF